MPHVTRPITREKYAQGDADTTTLRRSPLIITNRRKYERLVRSFPFWLMSNNGQTIAQFCTDDISNGGCHGTSALSPALKNNQIIHIELKIPRHTENTYMLETVKITAKVVRSDQTLAYSSDLLAIALEFTEPLDLEID